jgi:aminoglycoside 2'-N-acetyltransferase I
VVSLDAPIDLLVRESAEVDEAQRAELRMLWSDAYGDDRFTEHDLEHAYGGVHVIAVRGDRIVGHASAVPRRVAVGETWHDIGYVEAVATSPAFQASGVGTAAMTRLHAELDARWPFAMLSTGRATGFYLRLGRARWLGLSYTRRTDGRVVADDEHGGLMVRGHGSALDISSPVICEDRAGDAW